MSKNNRSFRTLLWISLGVVLPGSVLTASAAAGSLPPYLQIQAVPGKLQSVRSGHPRTPPLAYSRPVFTAQLAARPALAPGVTLVPCPEPQALACGYVPVPYDRNHPELGDINIYFEQYPHSSPGPAVSAILVNFGGPGFGTTVNFRDYVQGVFAPDLDVHDLLLVDDRGEGLSAAIDCPELQHGTADFVTAVSDCAAELGVGDTLYGTGDVAADMDAVRAALGYELIDYYGASYGGADAIAYATRFPHHTRSLVLDAPFGPPMVEIFNIIRFRIQSDPNMVRLVCVRSLLCAPDHPAPLDELEDLIESIRHHPIEGDSHDLFGNPVHIRVDETALLNFVIQNSGGFFGETAEVLAAAAALVRGDNAPLLRIAAEGFFTIQPGDSGDPTFFSVGEYYARGCVDTREPWDWLQPVAVRQQQYHEAVEDLDEDQFAPFSKRAATGILFESPPPFGLQCLWWEKPVPSSPIVPHHAVFPPVPTLVLDGDLDDVIPQRPSREVAELFPHSTFVLVAGAGHETTGYSACARTLTTNLIENLEPGDTSCASNPAAPGSAGIPAAVGRFPLLPHDARPLRPGGHAQYSRPAGRWRKITGAPLPFLQHEQ